MASLNKLQWWGYLHTNKSIQVKPFYSDMDISEAQQSPFVLQVFGPFFADDRNDAIEQIKKLIA